MLSTSISESRINTVELYFSLILRAELSITAWFMPRANKLNLISNFRCRRNSYLPTITSASQPHDANDICRFKQQGQGHANSSDECM